MRPLQKMEENNQKEQENKTPSKMARLAWPKAKYGAVSYTHLRAHET